MPTTQKHTPEGQLELFSGGLGKVPIAYREVAKTASEVEDIFVTDEKKSFDSTKPISRNNQYRRNIGEVTLSVFLLEKRNGAPGWKMKIQFQKGEKSLKFLVFISPEKNIAAIQKYAGNGKKIFSARSGSIVSFNYFYKANMISEKEAQSLESFIREIPILAPLYKKET